MTNNPFDPLQYEPLFPDEVISEILRTLEIEEEHFEIVKKYILSSCVNYNTLKDDYLNKQKPYFEEKKALKDFKNKAEKLKASYEKMRKTGSAQMALIKKSKTDDVFDEKCEQSINMFDAYYSNGKISRNAIPDFLSITKIISLIELKKTLYLQLYEAITSNFSFVLFTFEFKFEIISSRCTKSFFTYK